ncbi:MAG: 4-(cytidine 5'-diphospho)-2-C-methyl-D-erythritol kinase [Spirochaetales bacterium]|nr:MAG: 4-(cytidine 5'-diphospho)-2-C-methyl-D-erythritol kinase [Spirochaetales bacterium]
MADRIVMTAPAKINLHLAIGPQRSDGFHDIFSIFQAVSLADTVSVQLTDGDGIDLDCDCGCPTRSNTMYRAAELFLGIIAAAGMKPPGISIRAVKSIPSGAGLGGGSSDAAAVLRALSVLIPGRLEDGELAAAGAAIGSDVPFFLGDTCALVRGRGERLQTLEPRTDYTIVIVNPGFPVSTALAYKTLDGSRQTPYGRSPGEMEDGLLVAERAFHGLPPRKWPFLNDFSPVLVPLYPSLGHILELLDAGGADFSAMSGSGSALFGIFMDSQRADSCVSAIIQAGYTAQRAFPLARLPESV